MALMRQLISKQNIYLQRQHNLRLHTPLLFKGEKSLSSSQVKPRLRLIPTPGIVEEKIKPGLKVLLLNQRTNNLSRRIDDELSLRQVNVTTVEAQSSDRMVNAVQEVKPDLVICPFMKARIPEALYKENTSPPCLIVHPGVVVDRGASSLDWAILQQNVEWGVTVLEADNFVDSGAIWSTANFPVPPNVTKSSLYNNAVSDAGVACVLYSVSRFCQEIEPLSKVDFIEAMGFSGLKRNMKHADRMVDWTMPAEDILVRVRMSDTTPGAIGHLYIKNQLTELRLFDGHIENEKGALGHLLKSYKPGVQVATKDNAVLIKCGGNQGVWIGHMKQGQKGLKLPSDRLLANALPHVTGPCGYQDIKEIRCGPICFLFFDFYNGAMGTRQAYRLQSHLKSISEDSDIKLVALMGGERFFCTGIHLCELESSINKLEDALKNINAIDDVIKTVAEMRNKTVVAVLRGNAGAGGAMMAAACDITIAHPGVFITPTYKAMHLYGSEYWTYFLPRRVGPEMAARLTEGTNTITARKAASIGLIDTVLGKDSAGFADEATEFLQKLVHSDQNAKIIQSKLRERNASWSRTLEQHRQAEIDNMKICFQSRKFLSAMHNFVYKK
ncbi:hydrogenase maturation factor HoxX-like isoform X2 [Dreissena polymorpha]|nr:hydrogenase maturation factor HoxX-like isoform X2 [Dreissena polymorpha]XP_052232103.1 hydrogenase maturation factor HoxX-like isoform X2 [Dreissena polymorpha]